MAGENEYKRCMRCGGRKKLYKVGSGYSKTNCGGVEVNCPLCNGKGEIKKLAFADKKVREEVEKASCDIVDSVPAVDRPESTKVVDIKVKKKRGRKAKIVD